jgi:hypothetical protein
MRTTARLLFAACTTVVLGACAALPVSRTYLGSGEHGVAATAPAGWRVLTAAEMLGRSDGAPPFLQGFSAGTPTDLSAPMDADVPGGVLVVSFHPSPAVAAQAARNAFILDLDAAVKAGSARVLEESDPVVTDGYEWRQWTLEVSTGSGTVMRVIQRVATSVEPVAADANRLPLHANKTVVVGCRPGCFDSEQSTIDALLASVEIR